MPNVDKVTYRFRGEWTTWDVHFSKTDQFSIKGCPIEVIELADFINRDVTLGHIKERFISALIKAEGMMQCIQKVILVKFAIASSLISTPLDDGGSTISCSHPLYRFVPDFQSRIDGYGFAIDYRVLLEVSQGSENLYYNLFAGDTTYRRGAVHIHANETVIPYSEKAVESLENIKNSLKSMVITISDFFADKDNLKIALETGNLKLLT